MGALHASIAVRTGAKVCVVNLTGDVRRELRSAGLRSGLAVIGVPHTTCGVCINEDEAGLKDDLVRMASMLADPFRPPDGFRHDRIDDNARAHLAAALFGASATVPVADGELVLGTWQSLLLVEMDGPRDRTVRLTFLGA